MANRKQFELVLTADSRRLVSGLASGQQGLKGFVAEAERGNKVLGLLRGSMGAVVGLLGGVGLTAGVVGLAAIADRMTTLNSRLNLVTSSSEELAMVQETLYRQSQQTGTSYENNINAYFKLAQALKQYVDDQRETLSITDMVNKSLIVSGAGAEEAASFMLQFGQALGSGVLQGDEFRAMMEANSYFGQQLAKALDTDIAGLRKMSSEGKLTVATLRTAFPKMAQEIDAAFAKMPVNIQRAVQEVKNAFVRIVDDANKGADGTTTIAKSVENLAQVIDANRAGIISLFSVMINLAARTVSALGNIGQSFAGWQAVANGQLSIFRFAAMNAEYLHNWLVKNANDTTGLMAKMDELRAKQQMVRETMAISPEARASKSAALAAIQAEIDGLQRQKQAILDNARASQESGAKQVNTAKTVTKEMIAAYKQYADEVKRLQDSIAGREQSLAEQLRAMGRTGMSDIDAWRDRKAEAEEFAKAAARAREEAEKAFAAGDTGAGTSAMKEAVSLYDKARQAAGDLNREVTANGQVQITQQQALQTAKGLYEQYGQAAIDVEKRLQEELKKTAATLNESSGNQLASQLPEAAKVLATTMADVGKQAEEVATKIENIGGVWTNVGETAQNASKESTTQQQRDIEELTRAIKLIDGVWKNEFDQVGQYSDAMRRQLLADIAAVKSAASGLSIATKATGGLAGVPGFAAGGSPMLYFPRPSSPLVTKGSGLRDDVPALLKRWEFIQPEWSVKKYGLRFMEAVRRGLFPVHLARGFATGGTPYGSVSMSVPTTAATAPIINVTIAYKGSGVMNHSDAERMADLVMNVWKRKYKAMA